MGNRFRLSNTDLFFNKVISRNPALQKLYKSVNSIVFIRKVLSYYYPDIPRFTFTEARPLSPIRSIIDRLFFAPMLRKLYFKCSQQKLKNTEIERNLFRDGSTLSLYFDISFGLNGYSSPPHLDNPSRVAAFLIYFSDQGDNKGSGGEFNIYDSPDFVKGSRNVNPENLKLVKSLVPKKNLFVSFLSNESSFHGVPCLKDSLHPRCFIYAGITIDD